MAKLIVGLFALILSTPVIAANPCLSRAEDALAEHGLEESTLRSIEPIKLNKREYVAGYRFWYTTPLCEAGSVVVQVNRACGLQSIYTKRPCKVDGLRSWW
jgi:hypothetical protein